MSSDKYRPLARGDACQTCKRRKVRCPAERPACSRCIRLHKECVYFHEAHSSSSSSPHQPSSTSRSVSHSIDTLPSLPTTFNEPSYDDIFNSLSFGSQSNGSPVDDIFGLIPRTEFAVPELPPEWTWDWNTMDLGQVMGQMDEAEANLSDNDRDHLFLLYFTTFNAFGMHVYFPKLYANLHSTNPADRPHSCLLYAMFLVSCGSSDRPHLRAKEELFLRLAKRSLEHAIDSLPLGGYTIYDTVRASTLLAFWLFHKKGNIHGWVMLGQATRLAIACGLHQIPSDYTTGMTDSQWSNRGRNIHYDAPVPRSRTELGEHICTFWCLFLLDRCASAALHWNAAFDVATVTTPLPRAWAEYETEPYHGKKCNETLESLIQARTYTSCGVDHRTEYVHLIKSVVLFHTAATGPAREPLVEKALHQFVEDLGPQWKQPMVDPTGLKVVPSGTASLQTVILGTEMYLNGADIAALPNLDVLDPIRRMLGVLTLMRDKNLGDHGLFIATIWIRMTRILMIETKRLEHQGEGFAAASLVKDVLFIVEFLRQFRQAMVQQSVIDIVAWTRVPPQEFLQRELHDWNDGHITPPPEQLATSTASI